MQHSADFQKFSIRVGDRTYEFSDLENTRPADRALTHMLKLKQQEMISTREELLGGKDAKAK
jgi:hypothetical protein